MNLVYPLLVISVLVWLAMVAAMSWLAWKLWRSNSAAESATERENGGEVAQVPKRDRLTDYRRISAEMVVDETGEANLIGGWDV